MQRWLLSQHLATLCNPRTGVMSAMQKSRRRAESLHPGAGCAFIAKACMSAITGCDDMDAELQKKLLVTLEALNKSVQANSVPLPDRLWSVADIADYIQLSEYTTGQRVVTQPGFPEPISLASKRWMAGDIIDWAKRSRGKLPTGRKKRA